MPRIVALTSAILTRGQYKKKSDEREGGVGYEGHIITSEVLQKSNHRKYIPVLRKGSWGSALPFWAAGKLSIDLSGDPYSKKNYKELLRVLHDKWYAPPPVGSPPDFPDEEDDDNTKKPKPTQLNIDPKIAFRFFLGLVAVLIVVFGIPRLVNYFSQMEFPTPFPTDIVAPTLGFTPTNLNTFMPPPPTLTFTPALPTKTNTPAFTPTTTPLPAEITDEKGIRMNLVSAGTFTMGSEKYDWEKPIHEVYLDDYYTDIYEVTNAAYKLCVDDGWCELPKSTDNYNDTDYANHPVVYVNWDMAKNYCEMWRGARLPTEAEWEKAARGTDGRAYPWGESIDCNKANYNYSCVGDTTIVGSYGGGKSPYGIYDMAGNVWEWVGMGEQFI